MKAEMQPKGYGYGSSAKVKGAEASDMTGERMGAKKGIPSGKSESTAGKEQKFEGGKCGGVCYTHTRSAYK